MSAHLEQTVCESRQKAMLSRLPVEVMMMILLPLPAKSLGQCKCVCKSWRSLISSHHFVKSHINRAISDPTTNHNRLYPFPYLDCESPSLYKDADDDDDDQGIVDLDFLFKDPHEGFEIVGYCHGLFCSQHDQDCFVLWNPTIKDSKRLPRPPSCCSDDDLRFRGFGYVSSIDDYKVVRAPREANSNQSGVEVFSLKNNSWRRIEGPQSSIVIEEELGTCVNGSLHWLASCRSGSNLPGIIATLDLEEEKFCETALPDCGNENISFHTLQMINGCLSLLSFGSGRDVCFWVMKEYGVNASWTKQFVLPGDDFVFCNYLAPVCFTRNGDVIVDVDGMCVVRYYLEEKTVMNVKSRTEDDMEWLLYVESLISPDDYYGVS